MSICWILVTCPRSIPPFLVHSTIYLYSTLRNCYRSIHWINVKGSDKRWARTCLQRQRGWWWNETKFLTILETVMLFFSNPVIYEVRNKRLTFCGKTIFLCLRDYGKKCALYFLLSLVFADVAIFYKNDRTFLLH